MGGETGGGWGWWEVRLVWRVGLVGGETGGGWGWWEVRLMEDGAGGR